MRSFASVAHGFKAMPKLTSFDNPRFCDSILCLSKIIKFVSRMEMSISNARFRGFEGTFCNMVFLLGMERADWLRRAMLVSAADEGCQTS